MVADYPLRENHQSAGSKALAWLLYAVMLLLLILSVVFYKLRVFNDTAGYITDIVRFKGFAIAHSRYVSALNQWLPVLLFKFSASLRAIVIGYSIGYTLMPVTLALLCMHWLKRPYHALAILLQVTLMDELLFYYTVSELQSGLCLLFFFDALATYCSERKKTALWIVSTLVIAPTLAFSHPLMLIVFGGWLVLRLSLQPANWRVCLSASLAFAAACCVKNLWFTSPYEKLKKEQTGELFSKLSPQHFSGPFASSCYKYFQDEAFLVPILLCCAIGLLIWMRKYLTAMLLPAIIFGFFALVLVSFENWSGTYYDHYFEHMLQPAIFFLILCLCFALSRLRPAKRWLKPAFLSIVFIFTFAKIVAGSGAHKARQRWLYAYLNLMDDLHVKKAYSDRKWIPEGLVRGSFWSANWESLVLSSLNGPAAAKTLFLSWNAKEVKEPVHSPDEFVGDGASYKQSELPTQYFSLGNQPYLNLSRDVPDSVLEHLQWQ